ncbi:H-2 class I histocompatibility antigen, alpha chain-like [Takifugu rubripes]|uniref:H-2 class I histocompatibility antigen, alpha chain-like n=1 Tax=Takifugu rubripes TaxID=31033 RepID=H2SAD7_TAKRU|nr:H-2 class I histocompatibility antigen, alpha chain-like [Takifugu rubripes]
MELTPFFILVFGILGLGPTVNPEKHSLHYIYTATSQPISRQGIHEFTAMGVLDGNVIDYFDSDAQKKVPRQKWMEKELDKSYWEKGTESRKSKQQWFKVNINILKTRYRQNDSDIHILQWMHGCDADIDHGEPTFLHGIDKYSYDGANFLAFNENQEIWDARDDAARETKTRWDKVQVLREYTMAYLQKECVTWLTRFLKYQNENEIPAKPDLYVFITGAKDPTNMVLKCMATGFTPTNTVLQIKLGGRVLTREDGLHSTDILPNGDGTFQKTESVEIPKSDNSDYYCELSHTPSSLRVVKFWDKKAPDNTTTILLAVGIPVVVVILIGGLLILVIKKFCIGKPKDTAVSISGSDKGLLKDKDKDSGSQDSGLSSQSSKSNEEKECEVKLCDPNSCEVDCEAP